MSEGSTLVAVEAAEIRFARCGDGDRDERVYALAPASPRASTRLPSSAHGSVRALSLDASPEMWGASQLESATAGAPRYLHGDPGPNNLALTSVDTFIDNSPVDAVVLLTPMEEFIGAYRVNVVAHELGHVLGYGRV